MTTKKLDLDKFDQEFEILVDGAESHEDTKFHRTVTRTGANYGTCQKNHGEPCGNASNATCPERCIGNVTCTPDGLSICHKHNNQGCHGAGRVTMKPR